MDKQVIIEHLESLQGHCQSMIDREDPESIWRGDVEALTEAIKALSLDINKTKKEKTNMMSEVKVTIETQDGHKQELSGDTLICFTVSKAGEFLEGKAQLIDAQAAFIGKEIPDTIYAPTIGSLVASLIERSTEGKMRATYNLHKVAQILEAKSEERVGKTTKQEMEAELHRTMEEIFKSVLSR